MRHYRDTKGDYFGTSGDIPVGCVEVTIAEINAAHAAKDQAVFDAQPMAEIRRQFCAEVETAAEEARLRYITGGAGQAAVYLLKAAQADAFKAAGYPADASPYQMIAGEAAATGVTPRDVSDRIIATRDAWLPIATSIEGIRLAATGKPNGSINQAVDRKTAEAAKNAAITALQAV